MVPGQIRDPIPSTPIVERYRSVLKLSREQRLALARELVEQPQPLASDFAASVERFAAYKNDEPSYPKRRTHSAVADEVHSTVDMAVRLREAGGCCVAEPGGARLADVAPASVRIVTAAELTFDYLDREIVAARTTGGVHIDDDARSAATTALRLDLVLANRSDRTPILGEVKIKTDKDPFSALVQLLAGAVHLVTVPQYERVRKHITGPIRAAEGRPFVDLYLLLHRFPETGATFLPELLEETRKLSAKLLSLPPIAHSIRRVACLEVELTDDRVTAEARFAFERPRDMDAPGLTARGRS